MTNKIGQSIEIDNHQIINEIFGNFDENLDIIRRELNIDVNIRNNSIEIFGEPDAVDIGVKLMHSLKDIVQDRKRLDKQDLRYAIQQVLEGKDEKLKDLLKEVVCITANGKSIKPKTFGQKRYIDSIRHNDIVFGIGPAGTGKTYLAMAMAVQAFKNKEVNRIILTRPAVEAGENLGFLPGDLQEKVDPYLRPVYDALFEILGYETYAKYVERGLIEVAPLAYMRGRTLDSAYIILDEAQNTTNEQMKMFLTRLGFGSKAIITGDITQIDLPKGKQSGLKSVTKVLDNVKGIDFINLTKHDIVRHPLVQRIIDAYEKFENTNMTP
ncbi:PhoH family protein [Tissierella sp. Yu-01]|uniref:PhoH family protein n=1 Tax=Tissierella sp. Yu-01 TaxID=3035694 RepID=UPI00240DBF6E|nr:PhoH family protein [Tissierella sp. Yu-01]WFA09551.1 PhoH family protein [Tissierella sp. Yu-01]